MQQWYFVKTKVLFLKNIDFSSLQFILHMHSFGVTESTKIRDSEEGISIV